ncbi:hypothetical protein Stsp02_58230 [Streptomyces sp. NBRC 14336]|nr:hypothetical protein Stsp02_58230 [Streptomyces sp. NBRC 14336]
MRSQYPAAACGREGLRETPSTPPSYDGGVLGKTRYAAEVLVEVLELDDFESEDDEEDVDDFDDGAGELLDEEPRLSLR